MVMLAEHYDYVIGGDPDRDTIDLAVLDTATGRVRAHTSDQADGPAYRRLLNWAVTAAPGRRVWALEGTGSFAAGLVTVLAEAGEDVVEIQNKKRSRGRRTTGSTLSRPPGPLSPSPSRRFRANAASARRFARYWSPDKGC